MTQPWGNVLVVCTGNVCRSPYIERRLRQLLGVEAAQLTSAGTLALVGHAIEPGSARALESVGADTTEFASRQLSASMIEDADLVITAEAGQRPAVVRLHPKALRITFSLGELADLLRGVELTEGDPDQTWASHVADVANERRHGAGAHDVASLDIRDPYQRGSDAYAEMVGQCEAALFVVAPALSGPVETQSSETA